MKRNLHLPVFVIAFLSSLSLFGQSTCGNRDFEDTTFTNWNGWTGFNGGGLTVPPTNIVPGYISNGLNASVPDPIGRHTLITTNYLDSLVIDPATNLPDTLMTSLAPGGGSVSIRLGNSQVGGEIDAIDYNFTVTATNYIFTYQFACVMEDPGHPADMQPYFMVVMRDSGMGLIPNGTDTFYSNQPNVPFITTPDSLIKYRRWTPISVDLSAYVGQTIQISFINSDCGYFGHYAYTFIDASCLGTLMANVWPGDCDYDLQANNVDLLSLGISFSSTGPVRAAASNTWVAQPASDWGTNFPLGANYKHSDCNGDGLVDLNDTLAISLNYSQTHPLRLAAQDPSVNPASLPPLFMVPSATTVGEGNVVTFDVFAGTAALPINDLYGVAFKLNYNSQLLHSGSTSMSFTNSALGTRNVDLLCLDKSFFGNNRNDIALVRTTHTPVSGAVYLGTFSLKTSFSVPVISQLELSFSDVVIIDPNKTTIPVNPQSVSITIDPSLPAGITELTNAPFTFYPNPAGDQLNISTTGFIAERITITSLLGQVVMDFAPTSGQTTVNTATLAEGIYYMTVISTTGRSVKEVVIQH
jgi:hypothetical protein